MLNRLFIVLSVILVISACNISGKIAHKRQKISEIILNDIARNKFSDSFKVNFNKTGEFAMVLKREKIFPKSIPDLKYFVFSMKAKSIVIEDSLKAGNVYWEDDYLLKAFEREQKAESPISGYSFDVKNKVYIFN